MMASAYNRSTEVLSQFLTAGHFNRSYVHWSLQRTAWVRTWASLVHNKKKNLLLNTTFEGSRDGTVVRALVSQQCGPGSIPGLDVIYVG